MLNDYLLELEEELERAGIREKDDISAFIREMIEDRIENGETLETVLADLGEPEKVAAGFRQDRDERPDEEDETVIMDHQEYHGLKKIAVDLVSCRLHIVASGSDAFYLDLPEEERLDVRYHHDTLDIEENNSGSGLDALFRRWSKGKTLFNDPIDITIGVPLDNDCEAAIETVSGSIDIQDIDLAKVSIETVTGTILVKDLQSEKIRCESVSGNIRIEDCTAARMELENVSGKVEAAQLRCPRIGCETVSGNVDMQIIGNQDDYDIEISSLFKSGKEKRNGDCRLSIETVSGRISYSFNE